MTDLPPSQGNTIILVIVDQFSKACRLLPLPRLPLAMQTAEALFAHIFRHEGIPENIVSDCGRQFTSRAWKAFMECLRVTVSLTSGYRPQANGQGDQSGGVQVPEVLLSGLEWGVGRFSTLG